MAHKIKGEAPAYINQFNISNSMANADNFFNKGEDQEIVDAIRLAERETSGELRVHIDNNCSIDVMDRAADVFADLEMHRTSQRNGVLFYIAVKDRLFAVIGDVGINELVEENFWDDVAAILKSHFAKGEHKEGLIKAILKAGDKLKVLFPGQSDDLNELRDDISYSDK